MSLRRDVHKASYTTFFPMEQEIFNFEVFIAFEIRKLDGIIDCKKPLGHQVVKIK